jgi:rhodanese-related sulfurtransferase
MSAGGEQTYDRATPREIYARLESGASLRLVDVREPLEFRIARVYGAELVPLGTLPGALDRFDREDEIVVMCHHGIRSAMACDLLAQSGFTNVRNLEGGIDRWSLEVDPTIPRY